MRRILAFASLALSATLLSAPASAQRAPLRSGGGLEAAPHVAPLRIEPHVDYGAPPASRRAAWDRFLRAASTPGKSSAWQALWDRDTLAPARIFGAGIPAPGTVADAATAEAHARAFLEAHGDLLAPGVPLDRFELMANDLDQGLRTVAFIQRAPMEGRGLVAVRGARLSFRYRADRLFVLAAETFPSSGLPAPRIDASAAVAAASAWVAEEHATASLHEPPSLSALSLVGSGRVDVRGAYRVVLEAFGPRARWAVYVDARSGAPLARENLLRFEQAPVVFDVPVRAPQLGRAPYAASRLDVTVDGTSLQTDENGLLSWTSQGSPADVLLRARGPLVRVQNQNGIDAATTQSGTDGSQILWSLADDEYGDAQLTSFIHAGLIKAHARNFAPSMTWLGGQLAVRPNTSDPQGCNAFWDGVALNFLMENGACNNSGRVADVVYHEFGHGFHQYSVIPGAGALDDSLGEAAGDTMCVSYTHDPQMAPGFYLTGDSPLRQIDDLRRWPDDISWDPHETGVIWGGAMWDLRTYLTAELGEDQGHAVTDQLYYQALRRSSNIPTTYAEILAADDDDGDLSNGTPHVCAINRAFIRHGLAPVVNEAGLTLVHTPLTVVPPSEDPPVVEVASKLLYPQCASSDVDEVSLSFHLLGGGPGAGVLTPSGDGWSGTLPVAPEGTALRYSLSAVANGNTISLPNNPADPDYRVFVGDVVPIHCNDFETQIDGWTFEGLGNGDFEWDAPQGLAGDPTAAFSGQKVIGDTLGGNGMYVPNRTSSARSPVISVGDEENVRLQFRRWLTVRDGYSDRAVIYVNNQPVWQNVATTANNGGLEHRDAEWRFEDIDISPLARASGSVEVRFELSAGKGKGLGGWNIDDFCIMAYHPTPPPAQPDAGTPDGGGPVEEPMAPSGCSCATPGRPEGSPRESMLALLAAITGAAAALRRRRGAGSRASTG
ncbi:hemagglutinin protein [Minicystis rosea]|nr:hemagglutinin protein [Minicystis rosea]